MSTLQGRGAIDDGRYNHNSSRGAGVYGAILVSLPVVVSYPGGRTARGMIPLGAATGCRSGIQVPKHYRAAVFGTILAVLYRGAGAIWVYLPFWTRCRHRRQSGG